MKEHHLRRVSADLGPRRAQPGRPDFRHELLPAFLIGCRRETVETARRHDARPRPPPAYLTIRRGGRPSATHSPRAYPPLQQATGEKCGLGMTARLGRDLDAYARDLAL
jgi:hypothetical protein